MCDYLPIYLNTLTFAGTEKEQRVLLKSKLETNFSSQADILKDPPRVIHRNRGYLLNTEVRIAPAAVKLTLFKDGFRVWVFVFFTKSTDQKPMRHLMMDLQ